MSFFRTSKPVLSEAERNTNAAELFARKMAEKNKNKNKNKPPTAAVEASNKAVEFSMKDSEESKQNADAAKEKLDAILEKGGNKERRESENSDSLTTAERDVLNMVDNGSGIDSENRGDTDAFEDPLLYASKWAYKLGKRVVRTAGKMATVGVKSVVSSLKDDESNNTSSSGSESESESDVFDDAESGNSDAESDDFEDAEEGDFYLNLLSQVEEQLQVLDKLSFHLSQTTAEIQKMVSKVPDAPAPRIRVHIPVKTVSAPVKEEIETKPVAKTTALSVTKLATKSPVVHSDILTDVLVFKKTLNVATGKVLFDGEDIVNYLLEGFQINKIILSDDEYDMNFPYTGNETTQRGRALVVVYPQVASRSMKHLAGDSERIKNYSEVIYLRCKRNDSERGSTEVWPSTFFDIWIDEASKKLSTHDVGQKDNALSKIAIQKLIKNAIPRKVSKMVEGSTLRPPVYVEYDAPLAFGSLTKTIDLISDVHPRVFNFFFGTFLKRRFPVDYTGEGVADKSEVLALFPTGMRDQISESEVLESIRASYQKIVHIVVVQRSEPGIHKIKDNVLTGFVTMKQDQETSEIDLVEEYKSHHSALALAIMEFIG